MIFNYREKIKVPIWKVKLTKFSIIKSLYPM
jgi:hypothetical protein